MHYKRICVISALCANFHGVGIYALECGVPIMHGRVYRGIIYGMVSQVNKEFE